ncbi:MAG: hypothetical protein K0R65_2553 [Crocinitomicaceae bacterium]|jgi:hypothetical protein|nr:hypothetical protein [Crocinitomicaceae bacterium]
MNKFINILLLLIIFPAISLAIIIGFDVPLDFLKVSGANIPYKLETFFVFAALVFIIGLRRSLRRWMGVRMVSQLSRFQWNQPMADQRYRQSMLYLTLEALVHVSVAFGLIMLTDYALPLVGVLVLLALDHLFFGWIARAKQLFRVGITSKAVLVADRDLKAVYFTGLRKVSRQQQTLFFDYVKDLQVAFPVDCIHENEHASFREALEKNLNRDSVFFSESFKEF